MYFQAFEEIFLFFIGLLSPYSKSNATLVWQDDGMLLDGAQIVILANAYVVAPSLPSLKSLLLSLLLSSVSVPTSF